MKRRILSTLAIAALALSFPSCTTINNTVGAILKVPGSLIDASARSLSNVGM